MSAQKRPCDPSSSAGAPPEKRRDRDGGDGGEGLSTGASNAVETVIKLGGVSNSVRRVRSMKILGHAVNECLGGIGVQIVEMFLQGWKPNKAAQMSDEGLSS